MATSKGRNSAPSKSASGKKSAAPSKGSQSTGTSSARGSGKTIPPARGGGGSSSRSAAAAASKAPAKSAGGAASKGAASKGTASKGVASKGAASSRNAGAGKSSSAGRGTAVKSSAPAKSAASKSAASRNTSARASSAGASKSTKATGDARNDLEKILQDLLKDIYYAEKKLTKALGKMAKNATNPNLKDAFTTHQAQTEDQVAKLEKAFGVLGMTPKAVKCAAMDGLLEEANEHIEEYERGAGLDAALIVGAQKVEHYEMAAYGSMRSFAKTLGYNEAADIFEEIREQESDTDELLTMMAESIINPKAEEETEDVSESAKSNSGNSGNSAGNSNSGSKDGDAGDDTSNGSGREGGDDAMSGEESGSSISSLTDGNNREGASETGAAMGY